MDRRAARRALGTRKVRRAGTKRHTARLAGVKGTEARRMAMKLQLRPRARLARLLQEAA